jgi:hypothetical protein
VFLTASYYYCSTDARYSAVNCRTRPFNTPPSRWPPILTPIPRKRTNNKIKCLRQVINGHNGAFGRSGCFRNTTKRLCIPKIFTSSPRPLAGHINVPKLRMSKMSAAYITKLTKLYSRSLCILRLLYKKNNLAINCFTITCARSFFTIYSSFS